MAKNNRAHIAGGFMNFLGDLNGDGKITLADLMMLRLYLDHEIELTQTQMICGDINKDGQIDIGDMIKVRNHINGQTIINEVID
jgi:hypothetical protein